MIESLPAPMEQVSLAPKHSTPFRRGIQAFKAGKELSDFNPRDKDYEQLRAGWLYQEGMEA
jgi:hypothetical protein